MLESLAPKVVGSGGWKHAFTSDFLEDMEKYRRYNYKSIVDCLRLLRNKRNHWHALPQQVSAAMGAEDPSAILRFFIDPDRFPRLFMASYHLVAQFYAHEKVFQNYLGPHEVAHYATTSKRNLKMAYKLEQRRKGGSLIGRSHKPKASGGTAGGVSSAGSCKFSIQSFEGWMATASTMRNRMDKWLSDRGWVLAEEAGDQGYASLATEQGLLLSQHSTVKAGTYQGGGHVTDDRYKTRLCKDWEDSLGVWCPRGARCDFAHGLLELRAPPKKKRIQRGRGGRSKPPAALPPPAASDTSADGDDGRPHGDWFEDLSSGWQLVEKA